MKLGLNGKVCGEDSFLTNRRPAPRYRRRSQHRYVNGRIFELTWTEIAEDVGEDNAFLFGHLTADVEGEWNMQRAS